MERTTHSVCAIVVTFNRLELLKEVVESLRSQTYPLDILIVNNGSTDGTDKWLKQQHDLIVINQKNSGGAGGFSTGMEYACNHGYEYTWIMDDDVICDRHALEKLIRTDLKYRGFVCSRILDIDGNHCNVPRVSKRKSMKSGEWTWGELLDRNLIEVSTTSFVSVLIPTERIKEIGLPYKEYFIWGDDTEYTQRISALAPSYMATDSIVVHKRKINQELSIFTETDTFRIKNYFYMYRNRIHGTSKKFFKLAFFFMGLRDAIKLMLKGEWKKTRIVVRGTLASLGFNPTVKFPNREWISEQ